MGNCPHPHFSRFLFIESCVVKVLANRTITRFLFAKKSDIIQKMGKSFLLLSSFFMQIRNNIIILIGVSIMLSLLYIYRLIIDQPADKVLSPPPLTPRTTLTYQYRLCSDDRPCSPMREYYVSSMCYGYLDALSNTGSP